MRKLGVLKTQNQTYLVEMQEEGKRSTTEPRCPIEIYEKDDEGGWSFLESLDGEKSTADKRSAYTDMKSPSQAWEDAIEAIRFYDESEIVDKRTNFV